MKANCRRETKQNQSARMTRKALAPLDGNTAATAPVGKPLQPKKKVVQQRPEQQKPQQVSLPAPWIKKLSTSKGQHYYFHPSLNKAVWESEKRDLGAKCWHAGIDMAVDNAPMPKHPDCGLACPQERLVGLIPESVVGEMQERGRFDAPIGCDPRREDLLTSTTSCNSDAP